MVVPALIQNEHSHKKLKFDVMLDSCSTYVTERAAHELDLHGPAQNLIISGTGGVEMKIRSRQVTLSVSSLDNCFKGSLGSDHSVFNQIICEAQGIHPSIF